MREDLHSRCSLFVENRDIVKSLFSWESAYVYPLCAGIFAARNEKADVEKLKLCRDLLKGRTSVFSNFRGTSKMAIITMLAMSENPENRIEQILTVYDALKEHFWRSEYLAVTSAVIADMVEPEKHSAVIERTKAIYDRMKENHPILTSKEDSAFAALLAMTDLDDNAIEDDMERCYELIKPKFFSSNAVQSLSHVLSLGKGTPEEKCNKTVEMYEHLRENGYKFGKNYELPTLGIVTLTDTDVPTLAAGVMEVDDFLKTQKGFGGLSLDAKQRLMHSLMIAMNEHLPDSQNVQTAMINGVLSFVIAQQVVLCASIAAASAAMAASNSN